MGCFQLCPFVGACACMLSAILNMLSIHRLRPRWGSSQRFRRPSNYRFKKWRGLKKAEIRHKGTDEENGKKGKKVREKEGKQEGKKVNKEK